MNVLVTATARFAITSDGILWTPNQSLNYQFWSRYLDVYDEVHLLVRAKPHESPPPGWNKASGPGIKPLPIPDYQGALGFAQNYTRVKKAVRAALVNAQAIHMRLPCDIGGLVWRCLEPQRPYGVEVVGDPYDVFAPGAYRHPLRPIFRRWFMRTLQRHCAQATAAAYVTEHSLQRRYPPAKEAFSTHFSSIDLPKSAFVTAPRSPQPNAKQFTLVSVGTLAQLYKAPDVLINAIDICVEAGLDLRLIWVGDGNYRKEMQALAEAKGLGQRVHFCGQLPSRDAVIQQLDRADLFVLPSHQEGLPKAFIEAMARGLPCIGSTVGGIPELLEPENMVPPGDVAALAEKIRAVVTDPERMARMSARNLEKAQEYIDEVLRARRIKFYSYVREKTEAWLLTQKR
ncbi:glycosyltransferase family 4 protein [Calothrix sp. NIES-2098]|uniref:glycosyltransferase family 4 protein n=1 Tax=Calothrix sp. NIES-2098 TaxID=1954171 RepID=UPI000B5DC1AE|nr:group 1 glycosyl transferase [Calothrix sp. NIES-2098]